MSKDLSPEEINTTETEENSLTIEDAITREDIGAQPGPDDFKFEVDSLELEGASSVLNRVKWPADDKLAPDYAYVAGEAEQNTFTLNAKVLEKLIQVNRYKPFRGKNTIAFALRGAELSSGHESEKANAITLKNVRPDHRSFRCVIGFYFTDTKKISIYTGSTVPCRLAIYGYKHGGDASNMLPTGMHTFYIWRHKAIWPALRLCKSSQSLEAGAWATVLRNKNDYKLETRDLFDLSKPLDNVHCSYYLSEDSRLGASFSSWGCLTVRGEKTPSHQWEKFQNVLKALGKKSRVDLLLATGKDASIAATESDEANLEKKLSALRHGSRGNEVKELQRKLGIESTGFFGATTLDKFTGHQRSFNHDEGNGKVADGIYSVNFDSQVGWNIFGDSSPVS